MTNLLHHNEIFTVYGGLHSAASNPFIRGMEMFKITTSGFDLLASSTACKPSPASATTSMCVRRRSVMLTILRTSG